MSDKPLTEDVKIMISLTGCFIIIITGVCALIFTVAITVRYALGG